MLNTHTHHYHHYYNTTITTTTITTTTTTTTTTTIITSVFDMVQAEDHYGTPEYYFANGGLGYKVPDEIKVMCKPDPGAIGGSSHEGRGLTFAAGGETVIEQYEVSVEVASSLVERS